MARFPENDIILPGNNLFSRRITSDFRKKSLFPGGSLQFSGKQAYFPENSTCFPGK